MAARCVCRVRRVLLARKPRSLEDAAGGGGVLVAAAACPPQLHTTPPQPHRTPYSPAWHAEQTGPVWPGQSGRPTNDEPVEPWGGPVVRCLGRHGRVSSSRSGRRRGVAGGEHVRSVRRHHVRRAPPCPRPGAGRSGAAAPWPRLWMAISSLQGGRWPVALAPRPRMADCDTSLWLVTTDEAVAVWRVAEALLIVAGAGHGV